MNNILLQNLIELIARHTGLNIREQDKQALVNKVGVRMQALKINTLEQYYQLLDSNTKHGSTLETQCDREWKALNILITTGESYFFRDKGQIALLKDRLLPEIIAQKKQLLLQPNASKPSLRIWSAGCSTGEEVYSIAIVIKELIPDLHNWYILILGTDINLESIAKAQQGLYDSWSFRMVEPKLIKRYFKPHQQSWEVREQIRSMIQFRAGNLIKDNFPQPSVDLHSMDIIICRNVFIYFDSKAIAMTVDKFYHTLNSGGYLITGHAELHGQNLGRLQTKVFPESLVYQREDLPVKKSVVAEKPLTTAININQEQDSLVKPQKLPAKIEFSNSQLPSKAKLPANINKAEILFHQGNYTVAIQEAEQLIEQQPLDFDACYLLAQAWANLGKAEKATFYCEQAIEIDSLSTSPYYLLAHIAEEKNDISSAKKLFKKIIYLAPTSINAYLELGNIYQREGDKSRAKKMITTAWELLRELPGHFLVEPSKNTVSELTIQVNKLLQSYL